MRDIKKFSDIKKYAGAKHQVLLVRIDTGDIDENPYEKVNKAQGALDALTTATDGMDLTLTDPTAIELRLTERKQQALVALQEAKSELEAIEYAKFHVRGFTPQETLELQAVLNVEKPQPPIKMREVGWDDRPPLEQTGKVQPPRLRDEPYADDQDPVYLREVKAWEDEMAHSDMRVIAYTLSKCVLGCDLSDEDIKGALEEEAHPREPIEEYRLRLDQVGKILTSAMAMPVWIRIQEKITSLTGVSPDRVDFTSLGSRLQNLQAGNQLR